MQIQKKYRLEECASPAKDGREFLEAIKIDKLKGNDVAITTNGKIIAIVPVDELERKESGKTIKIDVFKKARQAMNGFKHLPCIFMQVMGKNGETTLVDNSVHINNQDIRFPDWKKVLPKKKAKHVIGLDIELLVKLSKALGCKEIKLELRKDPLDPITVRPLNLDKEAFGVIMPIRVLDKKGE